MTSRPLLSVVIPTTRPQYLKYSLASVLAQPGDDIEAIVAFNPPPGVELGSIPADPRVKLLTAPKFLPMHDNWESGFVHASGEWVTLLGDDDCYVPGAIEAMRKTFRKIGDSDMLIWPWGSYTAPDCPVPSAGRGFLPPFSCTVTDKSTEDIGRILYGFGADKTSETSEMKRWLPSIMRGAVRRKFVSLARERSGYFCHPLTPDYGAAAQIIALGHLVSLLDQPLTILNTTRDSMGASAFGLEETRRDQLFGVAGNQRFIYSPIQSRLETNRPLIFETLMAIKAIYADELSYIDVDLAAYLDWHFSALMEVANSGRKIDAALSEFNSVVESLDPDVRARVRAKTQSRPAPHMSGGRKPMRVTAMLAVEQILTLSPMFLPVLRKLAARTGLDVDATALGGFNEFAKLAGQVTAGAGVRP
jgi:Glycosyl transferase family 2